MLHNCNANAEKTGESANLSRAGNLDLEKNSKNQEKSVTGLKAQVLPAII